MLSTFLFISSTQRNTKILISVKYKVSYYKNKEVIIDDVCQLDVTENFSFFYSLGKIEQLERIGKKLDKGKISGDEITFERSDFKTNLYNFNTLKDYSKGVAIVSERIGGQNLAYVKDSLNSKNWVISNSTSKIGNLICQKAIKIKDNVTVTVWFCTDIPIREGPFYFYGLPGLIVKANNSLGWEANLLSVDYNKNSKNEIEIEPYKLVSEATIKKAKANNQSKANNGIIIMPNGTKLNSTRN